MPEALTQRSQAQLVLRRFRRHRLAVASLIVLIALVLLAFVGGALWRYSVADFTPDNSVPPSWSHPFGTDAAGRDMFAQVLRGTQVSIGISVLVALGAIIVNATVLVSIAILLETALSYLGFGVRPPDTSLGLLVSDAQTAVATRPWLFYFPGLFIILIALTINFIGDGLRDALDPSSGVSRPGAR